MPFDDAPRIAPSSRLALLMHDFLTSGYGKMGHGLLRYSDASIAAIIDRQNVGGDSTALTGIPRSAPIVANAGDAAACGADTLVLGVATAGGVLPRHFWAEIVSALEHGMSLVNGLHAPLANDPELLRALQPGRYIWDVRREPANLENGTGAARDLACRRVLAVGTDMANGKMTASIELHRCAVERGIRSKFLATGQIGICIAGDGVPLDAVRVDFASGAVEALTMRYAPEADVLWVEGQGSVLHPASTAWLPLMRGSCPTHLILCHRLGQKAVSRAQWAEIPPLSRVVAVYEAVSEAGGALPAAKVAGVSLITSDFPEDEARAAIRQTAEETGLPVTDVVRFAPGRFWTR